jgi:hypothetical protein
MKNSLHPDDDNTDGVKSLPMARGRMSVCVPGLTAHLRELKICHVRMEYQGAKAQGDFVHMEFQRFDGTGLNPADPTVHSTVLQAVFRSLLSFRYPNWKDGDGSTGDFRWDLSSDSLIHTHYARGPNGNERTSHHDL